MKGNSKRTSGNSLNPLGAQNKDLGTASQTLLNEVKFRLRRRLVQLGPSKKLKLRVPARIFLIFMTPARHKMANVTTNFLVCRDFFPRWSFRNQLNSKQLYSTTTDTFQLHKLSGWKSCSFNHKFTSSGKETCAEKCSQMARNQKEYKKNCIVSSDIPYLLKYPKRHGVKYLIFQSNFQFPHVNGLHLRYSFL